MDLLIDGRVLARLNLVILHFYLNMLPRFTSWSITQPLAVGSTDVRSECVLLWFAGYGLYQVITVVRREGEILYMEGL